MKIIDNLKKKAKDTLLCIKYPFLYPVSLVTGTHYRNFDCEKKLKDLQKKAMIPLAIIVANQSDEKCITCECNNDKFELLDDNYILCKYPELNFNGIVSIDKLFNYSIKREDVIMVKVMKSETNLRVYENLLIILTDECYERLKDSDIVPFQFIDLRLSLFYTIYHWLYSKYYNHFLQWLHCIPSYTWYDAFKNYPGWEKAFGQQLIDDLREAALKDHCLSKLRIHDFKEKWASLDISLNYYPKNVWEVIQKYHNLSRRHCIECGAETNKITTGYEVPLCDNCIGNNDYYVEGSEETEED